MLDAISQQLCTWLTFCCILLCFRKFLITHILTLHGFFAGNEPIIWLPQFPWSEVLTNKPQKQYWIKRNGVHSLWNIYWHGNVFASTNLHWRTPPAGVASNEKRNLQHSQIYVSLYCYFIEAEWRICVGKLTILGSDNGLAPGRRQAIIWTNAGILLIGPLGTNFSEILIGIQIFSFKEMRLKMSSAKWHPFCLGLNELCVSTYW